MSEKPICEQIDRIFKHTSLKKCSDPNSIVETVCFLLSNKSESITGAVFQWIVVLFNGLEMLSDGNYIKMFSYFSRKYDFKICSENEINKVISFIDLYWKKNHVLVTSRKLMDWQHHQIKDHNYSFVLAIDKKTEEIHAIEGFILSSQFDPNIEKPIRWPAIWKTRDDVAVPFLGMMTHMFAVNKIPTVAYGTMGISDIAYLLNKQISNVGYAKQWCMLHPTLTEFKLVRNYQDIPRDIRHYSSHDKLFEDCTNDLLNINGKIINSIPPYKSLLYYNNRFIHHPYYKYYATKIVSILGGGVLGVFFWRFCEANGARCIRIVDYFGDCRALSGTANNFQKMLCDTNAEFIDFINAGLDDEFFTTAGFINRASTKLVLANYFEPFLLENVDVSLRYSWYSKEGLPVLFFKGDSDQDRPNIIHEVNDVQ